MTGAAAIPADRSAESSSLDPARCSAGFLTDISHDFARAHLILSQGVDSAGREWLAVAQSTDPIAIHNTGVRLNAACATSVHDAELLAQAIDNAYRSCKPVQVDGAAPDSDLEHDIELLLQQADRDLLTTEGKGPVIRLVDAILLEALGRRASDVHVQPLEDRGLVRYRLDGVLQTFRELPLRVLPGVISRIKIMGRMDIAERRIPQDGRAIVTIGMDSNGKRGRSVDLRISTLPTSYGERAVIRVLDNTAHLCEFSHLGMPSAVERQYLGIARGSSGIILLTGPTGSGKTTTLYATLREIGSSESNIMTIEDPIEYELSTVGLAISQAQVNTRKGVTFAAGLRHILRQDPDIVMVGEVRDLETARVAIQASLTGHLVLSTLHTNDAAGAAPRLIDLGIEPYLAASSLAAVMAQRLVRTIHVKCAGAGCEACYQTGFWGRCGLFELLAVRDLVRELIHQGASSREIREAAVASGMKMLHEHGIELVSTGVTTQLEVDRVVHVTG